MTEAGPFDPGDLERCTRELLEAVGVAAADAAWTAALLVGADLSGHASHGLVRLADYLEAIEAGAVNAAGRPRVEVDRGSTAIVDGDRALGQVAARFAADEAIARGRAHGVACVTLRRSAHAGRLADYAERVAAAGLIALVFANDAGTGQVVAPPGALAGRLSTNPIAFGFPRGAPPHLVVDLATSVAAIGKIRIVEERDEPVPEGWLRGGLAQPLAGYKGFGLALAAEALAGVLGGAGHVTATSHSLAAPTEEPQGLAVIALDLGRFRPLAEFTSALDEMLAHVVSAEVPVGAQPVAAPGERSAAAVQRHRASGVALTAPTARRLAEACARHGIESPQRLEGVGA